jgi:hypothetical protein
VTALYFYDKSVSSYIKMLSKPVVEQYLMLRGVIPIDKVVWNQEDIGILNVKILEDIFDSLLILIF